MREDWKDFEASVNRPLDIQLKYAFVTTYKPVLDDESFRAFNTTEEYRDWCNENLPDWLGYGTNAIPATGRNT